MNLAEIRKKAEVAKKSAMDVVAAPLPEVDSLQETPEQELEAFAEEAEFIPAEEVSEELPPLVELSSAEEPLLAEGFQPPAEPGFSREVPAGKAAPQEELPQAVAVLEKSGPPPSSPCATPVRSGYDPLETILSGREGAAANRDETTLQQQPFSAGDIEEYLCFRVAAEEYALNIMSIKEIIKPREVTAVPRMPNFISGVISLRGVIIPVMDMRLRLSLPFREATGRERIVVLRTAASFCGILVDEVVQVARIRKSDIEEPPAVLEEIDRDFVRGLGHFDNRMLILLNLETITDISIH